MTQSSTLRHLETPPVPISQFYSLSDLEHLTSDLIPEARATTAATSTASAPNDSSPATISTEEASNFLSTYPPENSNEDPTSIPYSTLIDSPRDEPSYL